MTIFDDMRRYYDNIQSKTCHTCMLYYGQGQQDRKHIFIIDSGHHDLQSVKISSVAREI